MSESIPPVFRAPIRARYTVLLAVLVGSLGLLLILRCQKVRETPAKRIQVSQSLPPASFDVRRALGHAAVLAEGIGTRYAGSPGEIEVRDYLAFHLERYGYQVELQSFVLPQGGLGWNVLAKPLDFSCQEKWILLGAHHDSYGGPGANDNASGVGVALEMARALAVHPAATPTMVVAFGAEEAQPGVEDSGLVGSRAFLHRLSRDCRRHLTRMVEPNAVGRGQDLIVARVMNMPTRAAEELMALSRDMDIALRWDYTTGASDARTFLRAGIPAAWIWSGLFSGYHTPEDRFEHLQPPSMDRAGRLLLAYVRRHRENPGDR